MIDVIGSLRDMQAEDAGAYEKHAEEAAWDMVRGEAV